MIISKDKRIKYLLSAIIAVAIVAGVNLTYQKWFLNSVSQTAPLKTITINDNGLLFSVAAASSTVGELLDELDIEIYPQDSISPNLTASLTANSSVIIDRSVFKRTILVPYKTIFKDDPDLPYGQTKIIEEGALGQIEQTVLINFNNSQEILEEKIIIPAKDKIIAQGTKLIFTGFKERGQASWYIRTDRLIAAHPALKRGTPVLVTNLDNGKNVIVSIVGWGPDRSVFPKRIIDLSTGAFWEIGHPYKEGVLDNVEIREIAQF